MAKSDIKKYEKDPGLIFKEFKAAYKKIDAYSTTFSKREILKGKKIPEEIMLVRMETKPRRMRLDWQDKRRKGLKVVYDTTKSKTHIVAREGGLKGKLGAVRLKYNAAIVEKMYPNRFGIPDIGFEGTIGRIEEYHKEASKLGSFEQSIKPDQKEPKTGRKCLLFDAFLTDDPDDGIDCGSSEIYIDPDTYMPVCVYMYGFKGEEVGRYLFEDHDLEEEFDEDIFRV